MPTGTHVRVDLQGQRRRAEVRLFEREVAVTATAQNRPPVIKWARFSYSPWKDGGRGSYTVRLRVCDQETGEARMFRFVEETWLPANGAKLNRQRAKSTRWPASRGVREIGRTANCTDYRIKKRAKLRSQDGYLFRLTVTARDDRKALSNSKKVTWRT